MIIWKSETATLIRKILIEEGINQAKQSKRLLGI